MATYLIAILALAGCGFADLGGSDDGGYAPPSGGYNAPTGGYNPPSTGYAAASTGYGPPDTGYASPSTGYQSTGYDAPSQTYGAVDEGDGGFPFDLSKLVNILPLFLAVFAAIILSQLFAPLIALIFGPIIGAIVGLFGIVPGFNPGAIKAGLLNVVLNPFGLQICNLAVPPVAFPPGKRSLGDAFSISPDVVDKVASMLEKAIETYSDYQE